MTEENTITRWLTELKAGDDEAARRLWQAYFHRMVNVARSRMNPDDAQAFDEEDVALSAFDSYQRAVRSGRYADLGDRYELWNMLATITVRKTADRLKQEGAQKRGGGRDGSPRWKRSEDHAEVDRVADPAAEPEFMAIMGEQCRLLIDRLDDTDLQSLAMWRLEGYTIEEIAGKMAFSRRTIQRMLRLIRTIWSDEAHKPNPATTG